MSWPEFVVKILKLVDGDSICDFSGQGVPLVDHPVCDCAGPLQTFSRNLTRQSPRMTSDASGGAGLREWAAVDRGFTQSGVFLTGRGPENCGIFQVGPYINALEGPAGVEGPISKWSLQLAENSRVLLTWIFIWLENFKLRENVTSRSFSVSTKAELYLCSRWKAYATYSTIRFRILCLFNKVFYHNFNNIITFWINVLVILE